MSNTVKARPGRPITELVDRPENETPMEQVSVRYDADILAAFRAAGERWPTRTRAPISTTIRSRNHMDTDAERLARMQRVIDHQLDEMERLHSRPTWLPAIGLIAIIIAGGGLLAIIA
jgi:hypothetical protein